MKEITSTDKLENANIEDSNEKQEGQQESTEQKETFRKVEEKPKKVEKKLRQMENKKKKKWLIATIIIAIIIVIGLVFSTIFALFNINNDKIMSGVSISGIDVSGLTKEEAKAKMETIYNEKKEKEINIKYEDYESTLNPTLMEVSYHTETAVDAAYLIGKENNIFINNYKILYALIAKKNIPVEMTLNEDVTKQSLTDISVNLPGVVIESSYSIEEDNLIITKGREGVYVDTDKLLKKVKDNLNKIEKVEEYIEIPIIHKKPEEIDIDKIHSEIYKEAKDAYFTREPFTVYPEVEGIDFNVEEAKVAIASEDKEEYIIKLIITKPKITLSQIGSEAFPNQLSTFTTRYDAGDVDRSTNLRIACQKINGKVILPGETFSYNKALGPRTATTGYKNAKIYEAGQVVDGIGGGICQISSTLYNSVLMANLEIVERRNHQFVTSYVPAGRDATVVYGAIDFKFKNTRQYPIRIKASAQSGVATVSIYGIKEENEYTFSFNTKTVASIPFTTKYVEDASLATGNEKVKQKGANGIKTETYITKMLNGKIISTKLLSRDTYDAMTKIIQKGTKGGTVITKPEEPVTPPAKPEKPQEPQVPENPTTPPTTPVGPEQPQEPEISPNNIEN